MRLIIDLSDPHEQGDRARDVAMAALRDAELNPYRARVEPDDPFNERGSIEPPCPVCGADWTVLQQLKDLNEEARLHGIAAPPRSLTVVRCREDHVAVIRKVGRQDSLVLNVEIGRMLEAGEITEIDEGKVPATLDEYALDG